MVRSPQISARNEGKYPLPTVVSVVDAHLMAAACRYSPHHPSGGGGFRHVAAPPGHYRSHSETTGEAHGIPTGIRHLHHHAHQRRLNGQHPLERTRALAQRGTGRLRSPLLDGVLALCVWLAGVGCAPDLYRVGASSRASRLDEPSEARVEAGVEWQIGERHRNVAQVAAIDRVADATRDLADVQQTALAKNGKPTIIPAAPAPEHPPSVIEDKLAEILGAIAAVILALAGAMYWKSKSNGKDKKP